MTYLPPEPDELREDQQDQPDHRRRRRTARLLGASAVSVLALLVGIGAWSETNRHAEAVAILAARHDEVPLVRTLTATAVTEPRIIELPGSLAPFDSATLHARATGYIGARSVDIGSKVRKGDVLAVIAAPDLDQQLAQAKAQLLQLQAAVGQAAANAELGRVTDARTARLVEQGWSSKQQGDQDHLSYAANQAALTAAQANVAVQRAAVDRLEQLVSFEQVTAPFDGVITSRQIDVGSLVTADAASASPLFSIARTDVLRVRIYVPQSDYFGVRDGDPATITIPELPGSAFTGTVARNARTLAGGTRTLLTEVDVDNKDAALTAGLYGVVHLRVRRANPVVLVPSQAVIFNSDGLNVGVIAGGKVEMRKLELEADDGAQVEVRGGLRPGDKVILNPPVNVTDGMRVRSS
jgi:RND family efflux transporter MFP subunit